MFKSVSVFIWQHFYVRLKIIFVRVSVLESTKKTNQRKLTALHLLPLVNSPLSLAPLSEWVRILAELTSGWSQKSDIRTMGQKRCEAARYSTQ